MIVFLLLSLVQLCFCCLSGLVPPLIVTSNSSGSHVATSTPTCVNLTEVPPLALSSLTLFLSDAFILPVGHSTIDTVILNGYHTSETQAGATNGYVEVTEGASLRVGTLLVQDEARLTFSLHPTQQGGVQLRWNERTADSPARSREYVWAGSQSSSASFSENWVPARHGSDGPSDQLFVRAGQLPGPFSHHVEFNKETTSAYLSVGDGRLRSLVSVEKHSSTAELRLGASAVLAFPPRATDASFTFSSLDTSREMLFTCPVDGCKVSTSSELGCATTPAEAQARCADACGRQHFLRCDEQSRRSSAVYNATYCVHDRCDITQCQVLEGAEPYSLPCPVGWGCVEGTGCVEGELGVDVGTGGVCVDDECASDADCHAAFVGCDAVNVSGHPGYIVEPAYCHRAEGCDRGTCVLIDEESAHLTVACMEGEHCSETSRRCVPLPPPSTAPVPAPTAPVPAPTPKAHVSHSVDAGQDLSGASHTVALVCGIALCYYATVGAASFVLARRRGGWAGRARRRVAPADDNDGAFLT